MKMFGFMQQQQAAPKPAPSSRSGTTAAGKMFDMKNLGSIMKVKSTGCKSCGGWRIQGNGEWRGERREVIDDNKNKNNNMMILFLLYTI